MQKKYWLSIAASFFAACILAAVLSPLAKQNTEKTQVLPKANLVVEHAGAHDVADASPDISFQEFESSESSVEKTEEKDEEKNSSQNQDAEADSDDSGASAPNLAPTPTPSPLPAEPSEIATSNIFWCGDSVSYLSKGEIQAQFPNVTIDAKSGRTLAEGLPIFQAQAAAGWTPETVVIELGANTVADEEDFKQQYRDLLNLVPASATVYAVTIKTAGTYHNMHNDAMEDLKTEYPNLKLIDWYTYAAANEDLLQDGCHPTYPEGVNAFVSFVKNSM